MHIDIILRRPTGAAWNGTYLTVLVLGCGVLAALVAATHYAQSRQTEFL